MKRYDQWHHLEILGPKALGQRYLAEGRKWLGFVAEQAGNFGLSQQAKQVTNADGVRFTVSLVGTIPKLRIDVRPLVPAPAPVDLSGFVTWPTDADGATALPDSARVILAGDGYRQVRQAVYRGLFPDVPIDPEDPASALETGLAHAGNVDWHGKAGWVLSWYGPRTRYIDGDCPLDPRVFFKGAVLVDLRDAIDPDVVVLGAAVATFASGQWLVVVTEVPGSPRVERVSALPLAGSAPDRQLAVDLAGYLEVDSRITIDTSALRHPWYFAPDGKEARLITRNGGSMLERVISLTEDEGEPAGFRVDRTSTTLLNASIGSYDGYTAGRYAYHLGQQTIVVNRRLGPAVAPDITTQVVAYEMVPRCLEGWSKTTALLLDAGDAWQAIAVDYKADGSVVYGYGRSSTGSDVEAGDFMLDSGNAPVTIAPSSNAVVDNGDGTYTYDDGNAFPAVPAAWHTTRSRSRSYIASGLRVGPTEVTAADTATATGRADQTAQYDAYASSVPLLGGGLDGSGYFDAIVSLFNLGNNSLSVPVGVSFSFTSEASLTTVSYVESLYLLYMDLRYDALFVTVAQRTDQPATVVSMAFNHAADGTKTTTGTRAVQAGVRNSYRTRGWIRGVDVLDDTVVAVDTLADAPTTTGYLVLDTDPQPMVTASAGVTNQPDDSPAAWDLAFPPFADLPGTAHDNLCTEYGTYAVAAPPPAVAYALGLTLHPLVQSGVLTWASAVAPDTLDGIVGTTAAGSGLGHDAKLKWHFDADGVRFVGSVCCYKTAWIYSLALPAINDEAHAFRFVSSCKAGPVAPRIARAADPPFDHVFPIWVLGVTAGFRPSAAAP